MLSAYIDQIHQLAKYRVWETLKVLFCIYLLRQLSDSNLAIVMEEFNSASRYLDDLFNIV